MSTDEMHQPIKTAALKALLFPLLGCVLFAACKLGPDFASPHPEMPPAYSGSTNAPSAKTVVTAAPADLALWWRKFNDTQLNSLVEEAIGKNLNLKIAEARVRQARATRGVVAGGLWPSINSNADYRRVGAPPAADANLFRAGLDAAWELDVFGGIRRNVEAASADIIAAQEFIHDTLISVTAEVALNYVQLRGFQEQIAIAQSNLQAQRKTLLITRQRKNAGFVSALDVANAEAEVATTASQIPVLETSARQTINALSVLLARPPAELLKQLSPKSVLPITPPEVPAGLPSDLLRRRPDIRQAEARLHAATAQIGVATADLFPKFSLTGQINWQNNLIGKVFTDASRTFQFGPSITWPIFQGGTLVSNVRLQKALRDESYLTYQQTVLTALQDVENALIAFAKEWEHRQALIEAVEANRRAVDLATQLYTQGQTDFLNVLNAQRSLYGSEDSMVQSTRNLATNLIAIYKALGGGWEAFETTAKK